MESNGSFIIFEEKNKYDKIIDQLITKTQKGFELDLSFLIIIILIEEKICFLINL